MSAPFALTMARREGRAARGRLALYSGAIAVGVAALVATNSFRANVERAISAQGRTLMGADLVLFTRWSFPDEVQAVLDSAKATGIPISYMTRFGSMVLATSSAQSRLFSVRAVSGAFPYYGSVDTEPPDLWSEFATSRAALVDPGVLLQLDAAVGDTLVLGGARFPIAGTITGMPGDWGFQVRIAPPIYIPARHLEETGLVRFGSLVRYWAMLKIEDADALEAFTDRYAALLESNYIGWDTADEIQEELADDVGDLARFLSLVALAALLLGGVGVASGVHLFVREKLDTAALLRCLGAQERQVFTVYLVQAASIGVLGAAVGAGVGVAVQAAFPAVVRDFLPFPVPFHPEPTAILAGLGIGVWVSFVFAFIPLVGLKDVPPLRALRRDFQPERRAPTGRSRPRGRWRTPRERWRLAAFLALGASLLALTLWQAPDAGVGVGFALAIAVALGVLAATARLLMFATRQLLPARAGYAVRQGLANLFRPRNQTMAVSLAIGLGVFLIATLYVVHRNLLDQLSVHAGPDRPNLLIWDVQPDQEDGVLELLRGRGLPVAHRAPIVAARIARLRGRPADELLADTAGAVSRWAVRREYRHTYRDTLTRTERLVAGRWWSGEIEREPGAPVRISVSEDIAEDLGVGIGDRITWDIQGVRLESEVASMRRVNWVRFAPNFFVVFEPAALEDAPWSVILLTRTDDGRQRAELQRDLIARYPNISVLDLTRVQDALELVLGRVALAIRFMALFSIAAGIAILAGALAATRYQRVRESLLLKTLGAPARTIRRILATEYLALGAAAGLAGVVLAVAAGWALVEFVFEATFQLPVLPLALAWLLTAALTAAIGLLNSRDAVRRTPLAGLREIAE